LAPFLVGSTTETINLQNCLHALSNICANPALADELMHSSCFDVVMGLVFKFAANYQTFVALQSEAVFCFCNLITESSNAKKDEYIAQPAQKT
jgi:hypothetical protein